MFQEEETNQESQLILIGRNELRTEICALDLTAWMSLVIFVNTVLMTQWEEDVSGMGSREKREFMEAKLRQFFGRTLIRGEEVQREEAIHLS